MHCKDSNQYRRRRIVGAVFAVALFTTQLAGATQTDRQRELFKSVYETVERGDWGPVDGLSASERQLLEHYVLWPDLRAAWLRANLNKVPASEVTAFLDRYGTLRPTRNLRYRQALLLAKKGDLSGYQDIYETFYQGQGNAKLDCLSLQAELAANRYQRVDQRARDLWLTGTSQVKECDPVFEYLKKHSLLTAADYRARFDLAVEAREFRLARWLGKSISPDFVDTANRWLEAQSNPERFLGKRRADSETHRGQLVYAAERLTYRDPELAHRLWLKVADQYAFSEEQSLSTERHIALWTARDSLPDGYRLLAALPQAAQDSEVLRWRARTSLRQSEWQRLLTDVAAMAPTDRDAEEWQYWNAVALQRSGQTAAARAAFDILSAERSYYGFLAADEIGKEYALENRELTADDAALADVASNAMIIRARELFLVGLEGPGRSEWDAAVGTLSKEHQQQAAILAHRWGWHSRAIATAASLGEYDDLEMRYPLPWQQQFESFASAASISPTWAYGIARSESLFMRDVRSSAGAIGLMQLMPATGRQVAREIKLSYSGSTTLTDPESNIQLGTTYLGRMSERFGGNPVLATAAYNAGPHRVDSWLPENGAVDARIWIENIPFNETRKYVKRVLSAQAIFHWRMTGEVRRISDQLPHVAAVNGQKLASR
jgi:soluble lytic murein transglycosylase